MTSRTSRKWPPTTTELAPHTIWVEDQISDNLQYASTWIPTCAVEDVDKCSEKKKDSPDISIKDLHELYSSRKASWSSQATPVYWRYTFSRQCPRMLIQPHQFNWWTTKMGSHATAPKESFKCYGLHIYRMEVNAISQETEMNSILLTEGRASISVYYG